MALGFSLGARLAKSWVSLGIWGVGLLSLFMAYRMSEGTASPVISVESQPTAMAEMQIDQLESPVLLPGEYDLSTPAAQIAATQLPPDQAVEPVVTEPAAATPGATRPPATLATTPEAEEERPDTSLVQRLVIPALQVDSQVIFYPLKDGTWDITGLRDNIAWLGDTSWPGLGGNTVLAGHIMVRYIGQGPFRRLDKLAPGDRVIVHTEQNIYTYRVRAQMRVNIEDVYVTNPTENPQLTLLTCSNWDEESESYRQRLVVFADLEKVAPIVFDEEMN